MKEEKIRQSLIKAGVRNLREFGYPDCTADNIMSVMVFRKFFKSMLQDNLGKMKAIDVVINELMEEIEKIER